MFRLNLESACSPESCQGGRRREFLPSAPNLACYLALRCRDLRELQDGLMPFGLSSLARAVGVNGASV